MIGRRTTTPFKRSGPPAVVGIGRAALTNAMPTALALDTDSLYYGDQNGNGLRKVLK